MMDVIIAAKVNPPEKGHIHHIIPRCWFKHYNMEVDNSISNTVLLSWEDHKNVHHLAYKCAKEGWFRSKMAYAAHMFGDKEVKIIVSEETRKKHSIASMGNKNSLGHKHTDETKEKLREKMTNRKITWGDKISKSKKGKKITYSKEGLERKRQATIKYNKTRKYTISEETRKKISNTLKGRIPWNKGIKKNKENS